MDGDSLTLTSLAIANELPLSVEQERTCRDTWVSADPFCDPHWKGIIVDVDNKQ